MTIEQVQIREALRTTLQEIDSTMECYNRLREVDHNAQAYLVALSLAHLFSDAAALHRAHIKEFGD